MAIHIYLDISHNNLGDLLENPALYYPFHTLSDTITVNDIYSNEIPEHTKDDLFIFGGGGLIYPSFLDVFHKILPDIIGKKVLIAGHNFENFATCDQYPDTLKYFDLIGLRDYTNAAKVSAKYCPIMTCMHPIFDNQEISDNNKIFIYNHKDNRLDAGPTNYSTPENYQNDLANVIKEIASSHGVITNSYHGIMFAIYFGKPVVAIPNSTKFLMTRYPVPLAQNVEIATTLLNKCQKYPYALETDRLECKKFWESIKNLANNEMSIAYEIGSQNIGDNLVWFNEIRNHVSEHKPKMTYIKTNLSNLYTKLYPELNFTRPTTESYDRIYRLGVNINPNWRNVSMNKIARDILYLDNSTCNEKMDLTPLIKANKISEKYITYASHGSWRWKSWQWEENGKTGWQILEEKFAVIGYKMIDCSLESKQIPVDIIDGAITYIGNSELFIGGPSGLSWVAYYLNKKQVLISGVTMAGTEMQETDENVRFVRPLQEYVGCKNCYHLCSPFPATNNCAFNHNYECNSTLTPDRVFKEAMGLLNIV